MQAAASLKICTLMGSFSQYNIKFQLKGTEELPLMMLEWSKLEAKSWLFVWKMTWGTWWVLTQAVESLKICTHFDGLLLSKSM